MKGILHIFSCMLAFVGLCQKPVVSLSASSKTVEIGETIELTVKSNVTGTLKISHPDEFILGYVIAQGEQTEMNSSTGKILTLYSLTQNGAFKENGTFTLVAYITGPHKVVYKSNALTIKVEKKPVQEEDISAKTLRQPVFGLIQRSKSKVYEGEPLVLESKVYSRIYPDYMPAYNPYEIDGKAEIHDLENPRVLYREEENYKGQRFYTVSNAKKLVFFSSPGKYKIKPFEMILQYERGLVTDQFSLTSLSSSVEVLPLPNGAPKEFIGAVGEFELEADLNHHSAKQGDVIRLTLTVSGTGNLQNIDVPKLKLPKGIAVYGDPEIDENIQYGMGGAEGKITYVYNLQLLSGGQFKLPGAAIAYFDPSQKKYITIRAKSYQLEVSGTVQTTLVEENTNAIPEAHEERMAFIEKASEKQFTLQGNKWFWPTVLSPLLLALFGGLFWVRKDKIAIKGVEKNQLRKTKTALLLRLDEIKRSKGDEKAAILELEILLRSCAGLFPGCKAERCSGEELLTLMHENKVSPELIKQIQSILIRCEEARYSFLNESSKFRELAAEVELVLQQLT